MSSEKAKIFHVIALGMYLFGLWYDQVFVNDPVWPRNQFTAFKGRLKFLTMWNMVRKLYLLKFVSGRELQNLHFGLGKIKYFYMKTPPK